MVNLVASILYAYFSFLGYGMSGSKSLVSDYWFFSTILYLLCSALLAWRGGWNRRTLMFAALSLLILISGCQQQSATFAQGMHQDCAWSRTHCAKLGQFYECSSKEDGEGTGFTGINNEKECAPTVQQSCAYARNHCRPSDYTDCTGPGGMENCRKIPAYTCASSNNVQLVCPE